MTKTANKVQIDIWSDVMCPWCAIGYGQLSRALDELEGEIAADMVAPGTAGGVLHKLPKEGRVRGFVGQPFDDNKRTSDYSQIG